MTEKEAFAAGYKASGKGFYDYEIEEAWDRYVRLNQVDNTLDRHSPLTDVVRCLLTAIQNLSDNEYVYQDDPKSTNIHTEEVEVIINHLSHGNLSAIEISDGFMGR